MRYWLPQQQQQQQQINETNCLLVSFSELILVKLITFVVGDSSRNFAHPVQLTRWDLWSTNDSKQSVAVLLDFRFWLYNGQVSWFTAWRGDSKNQLLKNFFSQ